MDRDMGRSVEPGREASEAAALAVFSSTEVPQQGAEAMTTAE